MSPRPSSSPSPPTPPPTPPIAPGERSFLAKGKLKEVDDEHTPTYPPNDETRRVEENLRRWDAAERQRRKSARESVQPVPSLVGNLSRTASLLWSAKRPRHNHDPSLGNHVALQSQENITSLPIDDLNATPTPSPSPSPTPSRDSDSDSQNPFANPSESLSPFADPSQNKSITEIKSSQATCSPPSAKRVPPGPPMPLDLPPPRTPPPIHTPPGPTSSPSTSSRAADTAREDPQETMWWHEWLCGCTEGPERGGDYQSGRTNPLE